MSIPQPDMFNKGGWFCYPQKDVFMRIYLYYPTRVKLVNPLSVNNANNDRRNGWSVEGSATDGAAGQSSRGGR